MSENFSSCHQHNTLQQQREAAAAVTHILTTEQ